MMGRSLLLLVLASAVLAAPASVSEPAYWRFAQPDAKALAGIDLQRVYQSPVGEMIRSQFAELKLKKTNGAELLDQIERVFVSVSGEKRNGNNMSAVAILSGRFDAGQLRRLAAQEGATIKWYKGIEVFVPPQAKGDDAYLALVDPQTALLAPRAMLYAAIDRGRAEQAGPLSASNPLYQRAAGMASDFEMWLVSTAPPSEMLGEKVPSNPMLASIRALDLGVNLRDGLGLQLQVATDSQQAATQLATGLQLMLGMVASGKSGPEAQEVEQILRSIQVTQDSSYVRVALSVGREQLEAGIREIRKSTGQAVAGVRSKVGATVPMQANAAEIAALERLAGGHVAVAQQAAPAAPAAPPEPPRKMVIRIEGMDDGPLEIPYKKTGQ